jgi:hypothetical protein
VIPTFELLRPVYRAGASSERVQTIEKVITAMLESLESSAKFSAAATEEELPSTLLWAYYFAAQHFNVAGQFQRALGLIDKAIAHTPTLIELHMMRGISTWKMKKRKKRKNEK